MSGFEGFGKSIKDAAASVAQGAKEFGSDFTEGVSSATDDMKRTKSFQTVGEDLFATGAVTSHGGNLSVSDGQFIWITRRNAMLGHLGSGDVASTNWEPNETADEPCSRELVVHRAMMHGYAQRGGLQPGAYTVAVVHAHTRNTIVRSLMSDGPIVPLDAEGLYDLPDGVRVYAPKEAIGSSEAADMLGKAVFEGADIAVIKGHGPFAVAPTLQEAEKLISVLENSSAILNLMRI